MKWDYRLPLPFTEHEVMLSFTTAIDQSESRTQACHVRVKVKLVNFINSIIQSEKKNNG